MRAVLCALQLGRMLLGRQHGAVCLERFASQGLLVKQRKKRSIYHGTCAAHFFSSCGVVVEWQMYVSHCTCGALSIALVVRCAPDARDKTGDRDIPAPPHAAVWDQTQRPPRPTSHFLAPADCSPAHGTRCRCCSVEWSYSALSLGHPLLFQSELLKQRAGFFFECYNSYITYFGRDRPTL